MSQSLLLISSGKKSVDSYLKDLKKDLSITPFSLNEIAKEKTIGIDDVRDLQKLLLYKPYNGQNRLIVIYDFDNSTLAAQNSLLKTLEEPPKNTYIVLTVTNRESLLPTILSRVRSVTLVQTPGKGKLSDKKVELFQKLLNGSKGDRILFSFENIKNKENALNFLNSVVSVLKSSLSDNSVLEDIDLLKRSKMLNKAIQAKRFIEGNVNYKATIDVFLLGL